MNKLLFILVIFITVSCGTRNGAYYSDDAADQSKVKTSNKKLVHSLYLVGDTGEVDDLVSGNNFVTHAVKKMITGSDKNTSLVFLGDNIYPVGMPKKDDPTRDISEKIINAQLDLAQTFEGKTYFIPGNHDWNKHKKGGLKAIKRQEKYIEAYYGKDDKSVKFYPNDGCADPKVLKVNKDLVFVFLDTQWWMHDWRKEKKINKGCDIKSRLDLLKHIEEIFTDHKNDEIVVLMHHPIKSNGLHGGNFSFNHHLFPIHEKNIWIPLPIIGSLYPIFRQVTGSVQDITHIKNKELMQGMNDIAKKLRVNVIFASGHDHGMQYFNEGKLKYIVSGGGGKTDYVKKGGDAEYAKEARGFAKINFYEDFETWLEMYTVTGFNTEPVMEYRTQLRKPRPGTIEEEVSYPPITEPTTKVAASDNFGAGPLKKLFLGKQYRDIWGTEVVAENIDLETKLGGLTPIKKGGGMASNSLRMQHESGKQYILRSIKKDYTKLVPEGFENLKLVDVIADQNSASHPYSALIIPKLSQAAGVYYTSPKLVYLKHQRGLGNYNSQFPEELYLLEERPSGDWRDDSRFGNSKDIIGYVDLLENLRIKKNHHVDQKWVLKSRLFDLFIHDWDRHDDQWRWATFKDNDKTIYRPIPRDRDQAFYKFVGIIPWYISTFMMKKFKTMKGDVKDVKNLAFNAKHFDRYFLHDLEWSEWKEITEELQKNLTDEAIEESMNGLPLEVRSLNDKELITKLKSRRNNLIDISRRLYAFLSKEVDISASDNDDRFEVVRKGNGAVEVKVYTIRKKKGDILTYERTFLPEDTKEIRLYGLRGKDEFNISGSMNTAINIRVIGGEDKDEVSNQSEDGRIAVYDNLDGIKLKGENMTDFTSSDLETNEYDRNEFKYNTSIPTITFGNTVDDGFWFGGGISWTTHGWRRDPYKSKQRIGFSVAPTGNEAGQFSYEGHFTDMVGNLDFAPETNVNFPRYENFFGISNDNLNVQNEIEYNWVRMQTIDIEPLFQLPLGSSGFIKFGPIYQSQQIKLQEGRVTDNLFPFSFDRKEYLGGKIEHQIGYVDNNVYPKNGFNWTNTISYTKALGADENVGQFSTDFSFYVKILQKPNLVLGNAVGYQKSFGELQFNHFADLGNSNHLRGFRNNRFRGHSAFYHNLDLRLFLFKWPNNFIPMDVGIVGGLDTGRVWVKNELSDKWHTSQTIGLSLELLGAVVIHPYYSFTDEGNQFTLRMGFGF
ncbi:MAG: hypothetical protein HKN51_07955 [Saprospiraceae bacterium]|nr:hypothetical protein [Saprospiraceae bacterium]